MRRPTGSWTVADLSAVMRGAVRALLGLVNAIVPKQEKAVLAGYPDGEDSISELAREIARRGDIRTVLLVSKAPVNNRYPGNIVVRRKASLAGLWHYLTARYVFFTHGLYLSPRPPRSQLCVNVWHGMPFKRIGHMIGRTPPHSSRVIATSDFFRTFVAESFAKPVEEVPITGIPRNDVMVRASARPDTVKQAMGLGRDGAMPRLLIWLPTFRKSVRGIVRVDGRSTNSIFGLDDMDVGAFEALLEKNNCVCIAKPHPMAAEYSDASSSGRILVWREEDFESRGLSLYEAVGAADILITDASSVYVDYLLLDKPVILAFPDIDEYKATRGFSFDRVEDYLAGPVATRFDELCDAVEDSLDRDSHRSSRERIAALFHEVRDDRATERIVQTFLPPRSAAGLDPVAAGSISSPAHHPPLNEGATNAG